MEKAVLKTLAYYDIFDFPLKAWEIHKWLTAKKAELKQIEKTLRKLEKKGLIEKKKDFYFLTGRKSLYNLRQKKESVSAEHLGKAKFIGSLLKIIPWVKLVGISGSLSMMGSGEKDDIDFFIITSEKRIWLTRLCLIILTTLTGVRRTRRVKRLSASGKICINLILENTNLALKSKDIYLAHEVLQMRPVWQRNEIYSEFLHNNDWAFSFIPNWISTIKSQNKKLKDGKSTTKNRPNIFDNLEQLAKNLQLKIMDKPSGDERIESGALFFHPENKGIKIMEEYKKRLSSSRMRGSKK